MIFFLNFVEKVIHFIYEKMVIVSMGFPGGAIGKGLDEASEAYENTGSFSGFAIVVPIIIYFLIKDIFKSEKPKIEEKKKEGEGCAMILALIVIAALGYYFFLR